MPTSLLRGVSVALLCTLTILAGTSDAARRWDVQASGRDPGPYLFTPDTLHIAYGDTVRWVWVNGVHTTTEYDGTPCSGFGGLWDGLLDSTHPTFTVVFDQSLIPPGDAVALYECSFHCLQGMNGAIFIQATGVPSWPPTEGDSEPIQQSWGRIKMKIYTEGPR